jgi:hypothetical protein
VKEQVSALKKLWAWPCRSRKADLPADAAVIEALTAAMAEPTALRAVQAGYGGDEPAQ